MMYKSRKEAQSAGDSKFNTGKPCRNGHHTFRYTSSGVCAGCLRPDSVVDMPADREEGPTRAQKAAMLDQLPEHRLRAHQVDVPALQAMATLLCLARCPTLAPDDVKSRKGPISVRETNGMFCFRFPPEFYEMMRAQANTLFGAHVDPAEIARTRAAVTRNASDIALEERAAGQPGEWTYK